MNDKEQSFMVKGHAKIRLFGVGRIVDVDGNIVRETNLESLGEIEVPVDSRHGLIVSDRDLCGLTFSIDNIFRDERPFTCW